MPEVISKTETLGSLYSFCDENQVEGLMFYCLECCQSVCRDCKVISCLEDHNFKSITTVTFSKMLNEMECNAAMVIVGETHLRADMTKIE